MLINLSFAHQQESVMLKYLAAIVTLMISSALYGQTVIYYEDGSVYTVQPNEKVFVETTSELYTKKDYYNGDVYFEQAAPSDKVDYEEQPYEGMEKGSEEWCEEYAPFLWTNGYTFDDQIYIRYCTD